MDWCPAPNFNTFSVVLSEYSNKKLQVSKSTSNLVGFFLKSQFSTKTLETSSENSNGKFCKRCSTARAS